MNSIDLNKNYLYIKSDGNLGQEIKTSGINSIINYLKRSFYVLTGIRNYDLGSIWSKLQDDNQKQIIADKALSNWKFTPTEQTTLKDLLNGNQIELNSEEKLGNLSFNKKLFDPKIKKLFESQNKLNDLKLLQKLTYKLSTTEDKIFTEVNIKNSYKIDKMSDLFRIYKDTNNDNSAIKIKYTSLIESCKKADDIKISFLSQAQQADINIYNISSIKLTNIWSYSLFENLYFNLTKTKVSHVACEYHNDGVIKTSHMMEDYEDKPIALHQLFMSRFKLDLEKIVSPRAKELFDSLNPDKDFKSYLRNVFDEITRSHIKEQNPILSNSKNPLALQIFSPIISIIKKLTSLFTSGSSNYSNNMLCSEYAQISLKKRLGLLNEQLKTDLNTTENLISLPSMSSNYDFTLPQTFLSNWKDYLIPLENTK